MSQISCLCHIIMWLWYLRSYQHSIFIGSKKSIFQGFIVLLYSGPCKSQQEKITQQEKNKSTRNHIFRYKMCFLVDSFFPCWLIFSCWFLNEVALDTQFTMQQESGSSRWKGPLKAANYSCGSSFVYTCQFKLSLQTMTSKLGQFSQ